MLIISSLVSWFDFYLNLQKFLKYGKEFQKPANFFKKYNYVSTQTYLPGSNVNFEIKETNSVFDLSSLSKNLIINTSKPIDWKNKVNRGGEERVPESGNSWVQSQGLDGPEIRRNQ